MELSDTVSLTVLPRDGDSEAELKLYKDEGLGDGSEIDPGSKIGGKVYPVLYVEIAPGDRVSTTSTQLHIKDLYPDYFEDDPDVTVDSYRYIDLTQTNGWKVKQGSDWVNPQDPPASQLGNRDGSEPLVYRYGMTWHTHSDPLGNNWEHVVETTDKIGFQKWEVGTGWTDDYTCGPSALNPEVENVYIESCTANPGNIDYFKWDPDGGEPLNAPTITLKIADADPHKYCGIIRFRQTMGYRTWDWDEGGWSSMRFDCQSNMTYPLNLTVPDMNNNCLNAGDHEWGTYTYEIIILEYQTTPVWTQYEALDWNFLKRYRDGYHLWVPEFLPPPNEAKPGHDAWLAWTGQGADEVRAYYCLHSEDDLDAEEVQLVVVDAAVEERASVAGPKAVGIGHGIQDDDGEPGFDGIGLYVLGVGDDGTWRVITLAADAGGHRSPMWRTHDALRMLAANKVLQRKRAYVMMTADLGGKEDLAASVAGHLTGTGYGEVLVNTSLTGADLRKVHFTPDQSDVAATFKKSGYFHFAGHGNEDVIRAAALDDYPTCIAEQEIWRRLPDAQGNWATRLYAVGLRNWCGWVPIRHAHLQACNTGFDGSSSIAAGFVHMGARSSAGPVEHVQIHLYDEWIDISYQYATELDSDGQFLRTIKGAIHDGCVHMQTQYGDDAQGFGTTPAPVVVPKTSYFGDPNLVIAPR